MSKFKDGGPAFPSPTDEPLPTSSTSWMMPGMSLRDWYKGKALQGILATGDVWPADNDAEEIARRCGVIADAMLAEREKSVRVR